MEIVLFFHADFHEKTSFFKKSYIDVTHIDVTFTIFGSEIKHTTNESSNSNHHIVGIYDKDVAAHRPVSDTQEQIEGGLDESAGSQRFGS